MAAFSLKSPVLPNLVGRIKWMDKSLGLSYWSQMINSGIFPVSGVAGIRNNTTLYYRTKIIPKTERCFFITVFVYLILNGRLGKVGTINLTQQS